MAVTTRSKKKGTGQGTNARRGTTPSIGKKGTKAGAKAGAKAGGKPRGQSSSPSKPVKTVPAGKKAEISKTSGETQPKETASILKISGDTQPKKARSTSKSLDEGASVLERARAYHAELGQIAARLAADTDPQFFRAHMLLDPILQMLYGIEEPGVAGGGIR